MKQAASFERGVVWTLSSVLLAPCQCPSLPVFSVVSPMNRQIAFATLAVALVLGSAGTANAFFGVLGGGGYGGYGHGGCGCEASCGCEPSCGFQEAGCGCEPSCGCDRPRCGLFGGLRGLFSRNHHGCCEASCGCEPSCGFEEASCGCEPSCGFQEAGCGCEPSCGCESSCGGRRCCLLDGLRGLFSRHNHGCCEASCGCEPSCGCNGGFGY